MSTKPVIAINDVDAVVRHLEPLLARTEDDQRPVVLMTCGIAGSGKTTLARAIVQAHPTFHRLSNDEIIASRHGICHVDYDASKYDRYQEEADGIFMNRLRDLLSEAAKLNIIIDRSLYAKEDRDEFKQIIEQAGARWVLVYFKLSRNLLWRRICERRKRPVDANSALEISEELFDMYVRGFEHPDGEGEIVVEYTE